MWGLLTPRLARKSAILDTETSQPESGSGISKFRILGVSQGRVSSYICMYMYMCMYMCMYMYIYAVGRNGRRSVSHPRSEGSKKWSGPRICNVGSGCMAEEVTRPRVAAQHQSGRWLHGQRCRKAGGRMRTDDSCFALMCYISWQERRCRSVVQRLE